MTAAAIEKVFPAPTVCRDVGAACGNDAPDDALLVLVEPDDVAGAGQSQVAAVEMPGHEIVEPVVVDPRQPVGSVGVRPDPLGKGLLDLPELLFGGLGRLDVEDAALDAVLDDGAGADGGEMMRSRKIGPIRASPLSKS
jgi:hypothetical protein